MIHNREVWLRRVEVHDTGVRSGGWAALQGGRWTEGRRHHRRPGCGREGWWGGQVEDFLFYIRTSTFLRHLAVSGRHRVLPSTLWSDVAGCDVSAMTS